MYALQGDVVLDPFVGMGTTMAAALAAGRSSIGVDLDGDLLASIGERLEAAATAAPGLARQRLDAHRDVVARRTRDGRPPGHHNAPHDLPVITRQERELALPGAVTVEAGGPGRWRAVHQPLER